MAPSTTATTTSASGGGTRNRIRYAGVFFAIAIVLAIQFGYLKQMSGGLYLLIDKANNPFVDVTAAIPSSSSSSSETEKKGATAGVTGAASPATVTSTRRRDEEEQQQKKENATIDSSSSTSDKDAGKDRTVDGATAAAGDVAPASSSTKPQQKKPLNVIVLYPDDMRHDSLSCAGTQPVKTPFLDRLASEGIRFRKNCVTTSICWMSRATLFSGQYASRHKAFKLRDYIAGERWNHTFPAILREHGYYTGHIGE